MKEGKVKALCVVFNETSTGVTWRRLKESKELATKYGALFVVDAISILGGENIPVEDSWSRHLHRRKPKVPRCSARFSDSFI